MGCSRDARAPSRWTRVSDQPGAAPRRTRPPPRARALRTCWIDFHAARRTILTGETIWCWPRLKHSRVPSTIPFSIDWLHDGRLLVVSGREGLLLRREADGRFLTHADLSVLSKQPW